LASLLAASIAAVPSSLGAQTLTTADIWKLPFEAADHRITYGPDSMQFAELRLPKRRGPHPVAVLIHGGCWLPQFNHAFQHAMATALARAGVATWNIEYRLPNQPGGGWPNTYRDVADATDHVRAIAARFDLDTSRIVIVGHSVGAYLDAWDAGRRSLPAGSPLSAPRPIAVRGLVMLDGVLDMTFYDHGQRGGPVCGRGVVASLLGASPDAVPDRVSQTSPEKLLPLGVRQIVLYQQGGRFSDNARPTDTSRVKWSTIDDYVSTARAKGDSVEVSRLGPIGHFEFVAPGSVAWPEVERAILSLLGSRPPASR
jgi:acetyl esterase/lipase